jgi:hypothetical protein
MAKYLHHDTKAAREALRKLTAGAFRRDGETAPVCFSIPARCDDADLLLDDVIEERDALAADLARLRAIEAAAGPAAAGVRHSLACERAPGTGCLCGLGALRAAVAGKGGA